MDLFLSLSAKCHYSAGLEHWPGDLVLLHAITDE